MEQNRLPPPSQRGRLNPNTLESWNKETALTRFDAEMSSVGCGARLEAFTKVVAQRCRGTETACSRDLVNVVRRHFQQLLRARDPQPDYPLDR